MAVSRRTIEQTLLETYRESRAAVRRAHQRADEAAERARRLRESLKHRRGEGDAETTGSSAAELQLAIEENARSMREKERFVAIVSHELRQPLNALMAAFGVLEAQPGPAATVKARDVIRRQLGQMRRLLDDLLDVSRLTVQSLELKMVDLDLRFVIADAVETVASGAAERNIELIAATENTPLPMRGDAARLQQVFANLLSNAVRYTPAGGRIAVEACREGNVIVATVSDTGQGIAAGDLSHIFEPFTRGGNGTADGFGIGLALVRGIVELHDGSVAVESAGRTRGSTFTVRLPAASAATSREGQAGCSTVTAR